MGYGHPGPGMVGGQQEHGGAIGCGFGGLGGRPEGGGRRVAGRGEASVDDVAAGHVPGMLVSDSRLIYYSGPG